MGDVDFDGDGSGSRARAWVRVRGLVRCMGRLGLCLHLGLGSDVRKIAWLNDSVAERYG